jgi:hypothetical protein
MGRITERRAVSGRCLTAQNQWNANLATAGRISTDASLGSPRGIRTIHGARPAARRTPHVRAQCNLGRPPRGAAAYHRSEVRGDREEPIIFRVRPDPEPEDVVALSNADRPIMESAASREDRADGMDLPEAEARVVRILLEQRVSLASLMTDLLG